MIILIAVSLADGRRWIEDQPYPPRTVLIVTPRNRYTVRGQTADAILCTPSAWAHPDYKATVAECEPAVATTRRDRT